MEAFQKHVKEGHKLQQKEIILFLKNNPHVDRTSAQVRAWVSNEKKKNEAHRK